MEEEKMIGLDTILLIALVVPYIMSVRLSPAETPYWLFALIFLGLVLYISTDLLKLSERPRLRIKHTLLWALLLTVIGSSFVSAIIVRHQTHPVYMIHDILLQQEAAIRFFLDGKNPYAVNYFGTPLEQWHYSPTEVNPALYHFVMQPFYLLFALPFYVVSNTFFGFFDGRIPLLFLFLLMLIMANLLVRDYKLPRARSAGFSSPSLDESAENLKTSVHIQSASRFNRRSHPRSYDRGFQRDDYKSRLLFLILLAFNPAMLIYTLEGRSDVFMFAFLFLGLLLLHRGRFMLSSMPIALAFAVKQSAWPILPFYAFYLFFKTKSIASTLRYLLVFMAILLIVSGPFLVWDVKAFLDSTVFYLSGAIPTSYPISGYGFGKLLVQLGVIKDVHQYYPFHVWQILLGVPLLIVLLRFLSKNPSVRRLILTYGIFLFVFWYLSRYFNNSHLGYLSMIFITTYFWPQEEAT